MQSRKTLDLIARQKYAGGSMREVVGESCGVVLVSLLPLETGLTVPPGARPDSASPAPIAASRVAVGSALGIKAPWSVK